MARFQTLHILVYCARCRNAGVLHTFQDCYRVNFGLAIPSTPGFVGVFEALTRASLAIYGVPAAAAISFAVAYHFCSYAPLTVIGLWSLTRARIRMSEVQEEVHERVSGAVQRLTGTYQGTL